MGLKWLNFQFYILALYGLIFFKNYMVNKLNMAIC